MRVAIIEDSEIDRLNLETLLEDHDDVEIVGEAETVESGAALIEREKPDALFLDIHLGRQKGFKVFEKCTVRPWAVITSSHSHYALQGFEIEAVDYLLKPLMEEPLARALDRLRCRLMTDTAKTETSQLALDDMLGFKSGLEHHLIPVGQIQAIVGERIYTRVLTSDGREFLHNRPLREWRDILPDIFKTLDRSTIMNLREILTVKEGGTHASHQVSFRNSSHKLVLGDVALKALRALF